jgi:ribosome-binding protein aMBF1 (putative translation factor)
MAKQSRGGKVTVGRKREGQPRSVRNTDSGRFGQHLETLVAESGLSVAEFANRIETSVDVVYLYIKGTRIPPFKHWRKVAKALGLSSVNELLPKLPIQ